jgi:hypothetical protein
MKHIIKYQIGWDFRVEMYPVQSNKHGHWGIIAHFDTEEEAEEFIVESKATDARNTLQDSH